MTTVARRMRGAQRGVRRRHGQGVVHKLNTTTANATRTEAETETIDIATTNSRRTLRSKVPSVIRSRCNRSAAPSSGGDVSKTRASRSRSSGLPRNVDPAVREHATVLTLSDFKTPDEDREHLSSLTRSVAEVLHG